MGCRLVERAYPADIAVRYHSPMGEEPLNRVWILGAGFSRSLGAPLLTDLLGPVTALSIRSRYPALGKEAWLDELLTFYGFGTNFEQGHPLKALPSMSGRRLWWNAEHFLEELDESVDISSYEEVLESLWNDCWKHWGHAQSLAPQWRGPPFPGAADLARRARRLIAAGCSAFLRDDFLDRERSGPYCRWSRSLGRQDTILSFNYDRVIESLTWDKGPNRYSAHVVTPATDLDALEADNTARAADEPWLIKLHGSVDWRIENSELRASKWNSAAINDPEHDFAIATPGKAKVEMTIRFFNKLWKLARTAVEDADEIFIIGCRLAEGDAKARDTILDAIAANSKNCKVNIVLGTDTSHGDVKRLKALLGDLTRNLEAHPLWAEDFLSSWARSKTPQS